MTQFHNPYHFVPVSDRNTAGQDLSTKAFERAAIDGDAAALGVAAHHRFASSSPELKVYHGRLVCRLENEEPFFIGGYRLHAGSTTEPASWVPYELEAGRPAIPASSLRGLISAIAEAASDSALRVLQEGPYSRRALADGQDPLRWLGEVVAMDAGDGARHLGIRPLPAPISLLAYREIAGQKTLERDPASVIPEAARSYSADNREFWYLSQDRTTVLTEADYRAAPRPGYERGILRILGLRDDAGSARHLPTSRIKESFIPYPEHLAQGSVLDADEAIERFHALADECTRRDGDLPFALAGARRNDGTDAEDTRLRLRPGDLVYYACDDQRPDLVTEVANTAIWRKRVGGTRHDFFRRVSKELLPFSLERERITPAELVFGLVEAREKGSSDVPALGLAGRVRFTHGLLTGSTADGHYLDPVTLKVLDAPKPPYPPFYFKPRTPGASGFIAKRDLSLGLHLPQGRKFYLHRYGPDQAPWATHPANATDTLKQKSRITPVRPQRVFYFHIDFDNLTEYELGMLCYALRPTPAFRHKLGMGKPIGLGRVRIDPVGLFLIDRQGRYGADALFGSRRYHEIALTAAAKLDEWPAARYGREVAEARQVGTGAKNNPPFDKLRDDFRAAMDPAVERALALLSDPSRVRAPVHTPQLNGRDGKQLEIESYRWFVRNEIGQQSLQPLDKDSTELPTLDR